MSETTSTAPVTEPQVAPAAPRSAKRPARPRKANAGDIAPSLQAASLERHTVNEAIAAAQLASGVAMEERVVFDPGSRAKAASAGPAPRWWSSRTSSTTAMPR